MEVLREHVLKLQDVNQLSVSNIYTERNTFICISFQTGLKGSMFFLFFVYLVSPAAINFYYCLIRLRDTHRLIASPLSSHNLHIFVLRALKILNTIKLLHYSLFHTVS